MLFSYNEQNWNMSYVVLLFSCRVYKAFLKTSSNQNLSRLQKWQHNSTGYFIRILWTYLVQWLAFSKKFLWDLTYEHLLLNYLLFMNGKDVWREKRAEQMKKFWPLFAMANVHGIQPTHLRTNSPCNTNQSIWQLAYVLSNTNT